MKERRKGGREGRREGKEKREKKTNRIKINLKNTG
jgi:hypothetical protein